VSNDEVLSVCVGTAQHGYMERACPKICRGLETQDCGWCSFRPDAGRRGTQDSPCLSFSQRLKAGKYCSPDTLLRSSTDCMRPTGTREVSAPPLQKAISSRNSQNNIETEHLVT
jgi:hypothetical protein